MNYWKLPSQTDQNSIVESNQTIGMVAVLVSAISSGFAGVYHERLLKGNAQPSLIIRNIQLGIIFLHLFNWIWFKNDKKGMFSIPFCIGGVIINDWQEVTRRGFFDGYNPVVWLVIFLHVQSFKSLVLQIKCLSSPLWFKFVDYRWIGSSGGH